MIDNGQPALVDQVSFQVTVTANPPPIISLLAVIDTASLELTVFTTAGHRYQLQSTDNLTGGNWSDIGTPFTALGTATVFAGANPPLDAQRFYRIIHLP